MENGMRQGDLCLVTGVSGYLASWIGHHLIEQGYRVRGTVRNTQNREQQEKLRTLLPGAEFVEADLRRESGWAEAVRGVKWVFHVASPQAVASEKDRTGGAVRGTEYLLRAAFGEPSVEKVVLTSSEAAIAYGYPRSKQRFTEDDWTVVDGPAGRNDYFRSKTMAEKLAWDLAADAKANSRRVPLAVVNPGFIAGPSLVPWGRFSLEMLKNITLGKMPAFPDMVNHMVDVRDCALMHIAVMQNPQTNGRRHFSFGITSKMANMAKSIRSQYGHLGYKPRSFVIPTSVFWALKWFSSDVASLYGKLGHANEYVAKHPGVYRYRYTDLDRLMKDSVDSMLEHGWL
ncbi:NAD-dependent epimerase/dehydratase family protein [Cohnella cellulosilytica]|uniref:NAD-dependent epimerase/dehydratase family protein n=1 Tax=Cohnella cellulosilytica TaxID=986710 RepID=A0ABW2FBB8_9BACL